MLCLSSSFLSRTAGSDEPGSAGEAGIQLVLDFDLPAVAIAHPHTAEEAQAWVQSLRSAGRSVSLLHGGLIRDPKELFRGKWQRPRLCAIDESERRSAVIEAEQSLAQADRLEAQVLCLKAGAIDLPFPDADIAEAFDAGRWRHGHQFHDGDAERRARSLMSQREGAARHHLDALRRSLDDLMDQAENHGANVVLEPADGAYDLPSPSEITVLRDEYRGSALRTWLDVSRADRLDRLGFVDLAATKAAVGDDLAGITVSDGVGLADGLPPGQGQIPFKQLLYGLVELDPESAPVWPWVVRVAKGTAPAAIEAGLQWWRDSGLDGPPHTDGDPFPIIGG